MKLSRTLGDSWAQRPFCVPHFLITGSGLSNSKGPNMFQSGKGAKVETSQETAVQPWGRVTRDSSFELLADPEAPIRWEELALCSRERVDSRLVRTSRLRMLTPPPSPPANQQDVHVPTTPSLNPYYKTLHYLLQIRTYSFEGIGPLWPPLPGKAIKLFFSTSPKTLSEI